MGNHGGWGQVCLFNNAGFGFENTDFVVCILVVRVSRQFLPVGYLKGRYKSESSLMTCEAELHGSVTRMPSSTLSLIGNHEHLLLNYEPNTAALIENMLHFV